MEKMIEVRYAGVVVGRTAVIRELDTRGLFLGITEPLPVGTAVSLKIGDDVVGGRVADVSESQELARAGMRVRFDDPATATLFGTPGEAPPEPEPIAEPEAAATEAEARVAAEVPPSAASVSQGHRRIVVDASSEHAAAPEGQAGSAPSGAVAAPGNAQASAPNAAPERNPAADAQPGGDRGGAPGGGGRRGKRHRHR